MPNERETLIAQADAAHTLYPQYVGHWDAWEVGTILRRVTTKGGVRFEEGDRVLVGPGGPSGRSAYSWRGNVDVSIEPTWVKVDAIAGAGDYVETTNGTDYKGRVIEVRHGCPEGDDWLGMQLFLGPRPLSYRNARWLRVLVHGGGSMAIPATMTAKVEPFQLVNGWSAHFFGEEA